MDRPLAARGLDTIDAALPEVEALILELLDLAARARLASGPYEGDAVRLRAAASHAEALTQAVETAIRDVPR